MFKRLFTFTVLAAGLPLAAQLASALPADRLALANQLARRGLYAEALKEYEAIRNEPSLPRDEVRFRMGEAYRHVNRPADALVAYDELLKNHPQSRYVDYARLNRALLLDGEARVAELSALNHAGAPEQIRVTALYFLGEAAEKSHNPKAAISWYQKASATSPSNDVARLANLRCASLLAASADANDRRRAQSIYLDMAYGKDPALAKESLFFAGMLTDPGGAADQVARSQKKSGDGQLLDGVRVRAGRIENDDAFFRAAVDRDVIDAGAGAGNGLKASGNVHVVHVGRADQNRVRVVKAACSLVVVAREFFQAHRADFIQSLNFKHCLPPKMPRRR